jgi:hypothetical protein
MVTVYLKTGRVAEVASGASIEAGLFPTETGANPAPALLVKDANGATVAVFRSAEVAWYGLDGAVTIA